MKTYWVIEGYESRKKFFETKFPSTYATEHGIKRILKTLTAKHALSNDDIVKCFFKETTKIGKAYSDHLRIIQETIPEKRTTVYYCGANLNANLDLKTQFLARVVRRE